MAPGAGKVAAASMKLLAQLPLALAGALIMLSTGLFVLPGVPFMVAIKLMHYRGGFRRIGATRAWAAASAAANAAAARLLVDPRDASLMVAGVAGATLVTSLTAAVVAQHLVQPGAIHWPIVLLRQAIMTAVLVPLFTAKHQESHRRRAIYKQPLAQRVFGRVNEWWTGVLYGNVPEIDRCGHGFVHHRNDMETDDWANSHLDRANFWLFCQWVVTAALWHNSGFGLLVEFARSGCWRLVRHTAVGMATYYTLAALTLATAGPTMFGLLFAWPFLANVGFGAIINWGWHIFADPADASNYAGATITVIDWPGDIFSEGYHLTHHLKPAAHHQDMAALYEGNKDFYVAANSLLLTLSDPLEVWAVSMLHLWGYFDSRLVDFSGAMTTQQKRAYVRYRLRPVGSRPANELEASAVALAAVPAAAAAKRLAAAGKPVPQLPSLDVAATSAGAAAKEAPAVAPRGRRVVGKHRAVR